VVLAAPARQPAALLPARGVTRQVDQRGEDRAELRALRREHAVHVDRAAGDLARARARLRVRVGVGVRVRVGVGVRVRVGIGVRVGAGVRGRARPVQGQA